MKYLSNLFFVSLITIITISSCSKNNEDLTSENQTQNEEILFNPSERAFNANDFNEEVVFFFETRKYQMKSDSIFMPLQLNVRTESGNLPSNKAYVINGIPVVDNGKGNDRVANDGLYTALRSSYFYKDVIDHYDENEILAITTSGFTGNTDVISQGFFGELTISCDIEIVDCPNENWYDTSLFGEPCIEFSNCEITFSLGFGSED